MGRGGCLIGVVDVVLGVESGSCDGRSREFGRMGGVRVWDGGWHRKVIVGRMVVPLDGRIGFVGRRSRED
jgi:hypothetical protein